MPRAAPGSIVRSLELVPRGEDLWVGSRRGAEIEIALQDHRLELRVAVPGPWPRGFDIQPRKGLFGRLAKASAPLAQWARVSAADPSHAERILMDDALRAELRAFLALPGAWIGDRGVYVRAGSDLDVARRRADLAVAFAEKLGAAIEANPPPEHHHVPAVEAPVDPGEHRPVSAKEFIDLQEAAARWSARLHMMLTGAISLVSLLALWGGCQVSGGRAILAAVLAEAGLLGGALGLWGFREGSTARNISGYVYGFSLVGALLATVAWGFLPAVPLATAVVLAMSKRLRLGG